MRTLIYVLITLTAILAVLGTFSEGAICVPAFVVGVLAFYLAVRQNRLEGQA